MFYLKGTNWAEVNEGFSPAGALRSRLGPHLVVHRGDAFGPQENIESPCGRKKVTKKNYKLSISKGCPNPKHRTQSGSIE